MHSTEEEVKVDQDGAAQSGTLERGLKILEVIVGASAPLSLSRTAEEAGIDPSTAQRLLRVLWRLGYVIRDPGSRKCYPGPAGIGTPQPVPPAPPAAPRLLRRDVHLARRERVDDRPGDVHPPRAHGAGNHLRLERLSPYYETHLKRPIHSSAAGRILLATTPRSEWPQLLGAEPYPAYTDATLPSASDLERELRAQAVRGFSSTRDESVAGLSAVAAPIKDHTGRTICCLASFGHSTGLLSQAHRDLVGAMVKRTADLVSYTSTSLKALGDNSGVANAVTSWELE